MAVPQQMQTRPLGVWQSRLGRDGWDGGWEREDSSGQRVETRWAVAVAESSGPGAKRSVEKGRRRGGKGAMGEQSEGK